MIEQDTIKLLRECDAGVKMGVEALRDVLPDTKNENLRSLLMTCEEAHTHLDGEIQAALERFHDDGKEPNPMASAMSWLKTTAKLAMERSDNTVADLITDGCNMGVKSLSRYLNQYAAADEAAKDIAKRLISLEARLADDIRAYL